MSFASFTPTRMGSSEPEEEAPSPAQTVVEGRTLSWKPRDDTPSTVIFKTDEPCKPVDLCRTGSDDVV